MRIAIVLGIGTLLIAAVASADVVTSTATGGFWSLGSTWVGGVPPVADDDAVIAGPVTVAISTQCRHLTVLAAGELFNGTSGLVTLSASGNVLNQGTIRDEIYYFTLAVGGDIANEGQWLQNLTRLDGPATRKLSQSPGAVFQTSFVTAPGATGDIVATTPLHIVGSMEIDGARLVLGPDCPLTLPFAIFAGGLAANGNTLTLTPPSYLIDCSIDTVVLNGEVHSSINVFFTGGLTVKGIWQNYTSHGHSFVNVEGDLTNLGEIRDGTHQSLGIAMTGNLINEGILDNNQVGFRDTGAYHATMAPGSSCSARLFMPEIFAETLYMDTPLTTDETIGLGASTMELGPDCDLELTDFANLTSSFDGVLAANGNVLRMAPQGSVLGVHIQDAVLEGYIAMGDDSEFRDGVTVAGTLVNRAHNIVTSTVHGLLLNESLITEDGGSFKLILHGDAENTGVWDNSRVEVAGATDQFIGAGSGIDVPEFVLMANIDAASRQWTRNGAPLPGETGDALVLSGVDSDDYGVYRCEGDAGQLSRLITIAEFIDLTATPSLPAGLRLAGNHPNPFNPSTEFRFALAKAGNARFTIYDTGGREVAVLVDGPLAAGDHVLNWRADGLGSGVYLYRLEVDGTTRTGKATLLK